MTSNLRLPRTEYRCNRTVGEYSQIITYHKTNDMDVTKGDYGEIDIDIVYAIGVGVNDSTAKTFRRNMLLWEVGRPMGTSQVRIRYETEVNTIPNERARFLDTRVARISERQLSNIFNQMQGRFSIDRDVVISVVSFFAGVLDPTSITDIVDGIELSRELFMNRNATIGAAEPLEYRYNIEIVRKWVQYKDLRTGRWINAFYSDKAFVRERFFPNQILETDFGFIETNRFLCFHAQWYRTLNISRVIAGNHEHRERLLVEWRLDMLGRNGEENFGRHGV